MGTVAPDYVPRYSILDQPIDSVWLFDLDTDIWKSGVAQLRFVMKRWCLGKGVRQAAPFRLDSGRQTSTLGSSFLFLRDTFPCCLTLLCKVRCSVVVLGWSLVHRGQRQRNRGTRAPSQSVEETVKQFKAEQAGSCATSSSLPSTRTSGLRTLRIRAP